MANVRQRIVFNRPIHIKRQLLGVGEISVSVGAEVVPEEVLGRSNLSRGFSTIRLARDLGVSPLEALKYLTKPLGSTIFKGELLAAKKGLVFKKEILSPTDGEIMSYDQKNGELRLRFLSKQVPLTSGVYGIVDAVDKTAGIVLIKTLATIVNGVFGFGFERSGVLDFVGGQTAPIRAPQISSAMYQHIVVGGALMSLDALKRAAGIGLEGIITGGLNMGDYKAMVGSLKEDSRLNEDVGMTIVATEGFGPTPIGDDIYKALKEYQGRYVFINGASRHIVLPSGKKDSLVSLRRVSLPVQNGTVEPAELSLGELAVGSKVRIVWPPLFGSLGEVVAIDSSPTLLPSGISTVLVTVSTPSRKVKVPFPNLELVV